MNATYLKYFERYQKNKNEKESRQQIPKTKMSNKNNIFEETKEPISILQRFFEKKDQIINIFEKNEKSSNEDLKPLIILMWF